VADPRQEVIVMLPERGSYSWPGRERVDERTRILIESRTIEELMDATGTVDAENLESVLGYWEYLQDDWRYLHDAEFRKQRPNYFSTHSAALREGGHYLRSTKWRGEIPKHDTVSAYLDSFRN
jgi:hypothetical protein